MMLLVLVCYLAFANSASITIGTVPSTIPSSGSFTVTNINWNDSTGNSKFAVIDLLHPTTYAWYGKGQRSVSGTSGSGQSVTVTYSSAPPSGLAQMLVKIALFPSGYATNTGIANNAYTEYKINIKWPATPAPPPPPATSPPSPPGPTSAPPPPGTTPSYPRLKGINLSGAEFGINVWWGTRDSNYIMPTTGDVDNFKGKKFNLLRVCANWERVQPTLNGDLGSTYMSQIDGLISRITSAQGSIPAAYALLDIHSYARYTVEGQAGQPITPSGAVTYAHFANLWTKLANRYKGNAYVMFGLMNEPHDMPTSDWFGGAQAAVTAIRNTGATNLIVISGNSWSSAANWASVNGGQLQSTPINDPKKNFVFDVHQYVDYDASGTHADCGTTKGSDALKAFYNWAKPLKYKAILSEFGADGRQDANGCKTAIQNMINYMNGDGSSVFIGWAWWTSGRGYGADQLFNLQPGANYVDVIYSWINGYLAASSTTWTAAAEVTDSPNNDFMKQNIYIVVGAVVIALLFIMLAVVITLRMRTSRKRFNSYQREEVESEKPSEQSAPIALVATSSVADLETPQQERTSVEQDIPLSSAAPTAASEWQIQTDETGKQYYYNNTTGQSQWETPDVAVN